MPFSGPGDESLPANVKALDEDKRAQWVEVWNSSFASCMADDGDEGECESSAFAQANGVISEDRKETLLQKIWGAIEGAKLPGLRDLWPMPTPERAISWGRIADQVYEAMWEGVPEHSDAWPIDFFVENGISYVLANDGGLLWRVDYSVEDDNVVLGDWIQVTESHTPTTTRTTVTRQKDGSYRWLSISATSVLNRSGEIDSRDLFDSFVAHAEKTGEYPMRQFYHLGPAFRTGQADFLARDGNCYLTGGVFDDTEFAKREIEAIENEPGYWGESIGFMPTSEPEMAPITQDIKIPVYRQGINVEISGLPEREAASLFTRTELTEVVMLNDKARQALLKRFGGDEAALKKWLEDNPDTQNRAIDEGGLITRDTDETPVEGGEKTEVTETVLDDSLVDEVVGRVVETEGVQAIITRQADLVEGLTKLNETVSQAMGQMAEMAVAIEALQATDEEKRREIMEDVPPPKRHVFSYQPRQAAQATPAKEKTAAELAEANLPQDPYQ